MLLVVAASWIMKPNAHIAYMRWRRRRRRRSRGRWSHCDCLTAIMNMQWWFDMPCRCRHLCTCREIGVIVGGGGGAPLQKENEASFWRVFAAFVYSVYFYFLLPVRPVQVIQTQTCLLGWSLRVCASHGLRLEAGLELECVPGAMGIGSGSLCELLFL
jgi:hypothetical protein